MKRFYKFVSLGEVPGGYSILLDSKPVKTPARSLLKTEYVGLANAILQEWSAQGEKVLVHSMPLMQLLATKIDRVGTERAAMTDALMKYMNTDLLCYRAAQPPEIALRQPAAWDPWLKWFETEFGAVLATTNDLKALTQPAAAHEAVLDYVEDLDDDHFTIFQLIVPLTGSIVLALAFVKGAATTQQVFDAARVEEAYKAELYNEKKYGPDPSQEKKDRETRKDLQAAADYLNFIS